MNAISRFFWFCSGVHQATLDKHPTEHNKYIGIGATIFFTGLFAALSGGYAMYFVFKGGDGAIWFALFFGLLWGLAIFNMDRYIVSSIDKNASSRKQILQATPRILLAIMIGMVISRPLELKIFDKEIKDGSK
jgi:glycerol-3-phosphate acyltransferase PlsY